MLKRALAGTQGRTPQPITDEFAQAIAKRLESRGIVKVPGLPDDEPEQTWTDRVVGYLRHMEDFEAERAKRLADEEEKAAAPQTTAGIVRAAIASSSGSSGHIPLNSERVLRAALAGMGTEGTINGGAAE